MSVLRCVNLSYGMRPAESQLELRAA